jgi:hypothetical protein
MTQALATKTNSTEALEKALVGGDLSTLSAPERIHYYKRTCESLGLNPLTKPFEYIKLNNKLTLYARKDATDQLRKINGVSIGEPKINFENDWIIVTVAATDQSGRSDSEIGVVNKKDMQGNYGNALMKAVTKAKRRVTLSICGLGMLDETEVETIPDVQYVPTPDFEHSEEVRIIDDEPTPKQIEQPKSANVSQSKVKKAVELAEKLVMNHDFDPEALALRFLPEGVPNFDSLSEDQAGAIVPELARFLTDQTAGRK